MPQELASLFLCNQGQLYGAAQVKYRAYSPALVTPGPALLPATGTKRQSEREHFSLTHASTWQTSCKASSPMLRPFGPAYLDFCHQGQLYCFAQVRDRASSQDPGLSSPVLLQAVRGEGVGRHLFLAHATL